VSIKNAASTKGIAIATASTPVLVLVLVADAEGLKAEGLVLEGGEVAVTVKVTTVPDAPGLGIDANSPVMLEKEIWEGICVKLELAQFETK